MRTTEQLSVALPNDMPAQVRAVEQWLRNAVVPAYDAYKADPSRGMSLADVRIGLAEHHERAARLG